MALNSMWQMAWMEGGAAVQRVHAAPRHLGRLNQQRLRRAAGQGGGLGQQQLRVHDQCAGLGLQGGDQGQFFLQIGLAKGRQGQGAQGHP